MDVSLFDFQLPEECIALRPASPRDSARMMVVLGDGRIEHRHVRDLPDYLKPADALVVNDTRVFSARLHGQRVRAAGPANIEILLHRRLAANRFSALARPARKLLVGDAVIFDTLRATVSARTEGGGVEIDFAVSGADLDAAIAEHGEIPLPPYIVHKRRPDRQDAEDYQTIFARQTGSAAAPTAGLHFTPELLARLDSAGIARETVTLHVGLGTFLPVTVEDTGAHRMHSERARIDDATATRLNAIHSQRGRILAAGTTSLRVLESAADENGLLHDLDRDTDIFITPGYRFRVADMLLTNFHLPQSTLFMLVAAFKGLDAMQAAYAEAIARGYRFYSYGDACLLIRAA